MGRAVNGEHGVELVGLLQTLGLRGGPKVLAMSEPTAPVPEGPPLNYLPLNATYKPFAVAATPNAQIGQYVQPWSIPTAVAAVPPGVQLFCGVEAINRNNNITTHGGIPFFQQTIRPGVGSLNMTTLDGGRPGMPLGVGGVAQTWGAIRQARASARDTMANQLLGW